MFNTFNKKKSFFYIIFAIFALFAFALGGSFLFVQNIKGVSAATDEQIEVVESQKYVQHTSQSVVGIDKKSVFFYVSVGKEIGTGESKTFEQTLVENGKTQFVKDDEKVVISFARKAYTEGNTQKTDGDVALAKDGEKELNTTAKVSFATMLTRVDGQDVEGFSNVTQIGDREYFYKEVDCKDLIEGKYDFVINYNFEDEDTGVVSQLNITYSVYLLKNSTYNLEDETPNVKFSEGVSSVYLNTDKVAYERFYNYQHTGVLSKDGFGLATLSYNASHFRVSVSRQFEGKIQGYDFSVVNSKLVCTKSDDSAPDLVHSLVLGTASIVLKDLGTYNISYTYIYATSVGEVELETQDFVRGDVLNIFGYQAFYSDYENDLTEFRSEATKSFAADVTHKNYKMVENVLKDKEGTGSSVDISKLKIVSTNQAPIRMKFNSSFVSQTYYKLVDGTWTKQNDQRIIFTDPGIYFVEYTYNFDGYKYTSGNVVIDESVIQNKTEFTQQFLFEITTTTPIVELKSVDQDGNRETVYSGTFTKENVVINVAPGTEFDSSVQVVVSKANFQNISLFNPVATISDGDYMLSESGKYKIETRFGKDFKKTNIAYFTIDKEEISGLVAKTVTMADYTDVYVKNQTISGLFTNLQFALSWNNKMSGAIIHCDYQLIPLEKLNSTTISPIREDEEIWISSGAYLKWSSADINNFVPYANTLNKVAVSGSEILNEAGLYLFKLTDEAGHEAEFYVFLDNSETKFLQKRSESEGGEYFEPTALNNVSSDTTVVWGTHKTISISGITATNIANDNIGRLKNFFNKYSKSEYIASMDSSAILFKNRIQEVLLQTDLDGVSKLGGTSYVVNVLKNGQPNEQIYNFFSIDSANKKVSTGTTFSEFDTSVYSGHHSIKVSTDMSKSMMISSREINLGADGNPNIVELTQYGSSVVMPVDPNDPVDIVPDNLEDYLKLKNLKNFYFTNKDVVYFALIKDIDEDIKVSTISCDYYALTYDADKKTYAYSQTPTSVDINLELWTEYNNYLSSIGDSSVFYVGSVNIGEGEMTSAGKYVISRKYDESAGVNALSQKYDYFTREYVFFVDRNPVLSEPSTFGETLAKKVGEYIKMFVLAGNESEVMFDAFYRQPQVANKNDLSSISDILTTNKLPVRIFVPFAKYGYEEGGVFTTDSLNANIITAYSNEIATQILHPNLNMRVVVTFRSGNNIKKAEYTFASIKNGYLGISDITEANGNVVGDYFVDIYDGMGNSWLYKFTISNASPSMDFVGVTNNGQTKTAITESSNFTNADELRVEWSDPQSEYLAKIDRGDGEITYKINGRQYEVGADEIQTEGSKFFFIISQKLVGGEFVELQDGDEIVVFSHFEGNAADYPTGAYYFERKITIDHTAPVLNLNKMTDGVIVKNSSDLALTREVGKKYNKTIRTGESAYISYAISKDFRFEFSNFTSETANVYYREFNQKYEQEVKETNVPTDPNSNGANMFNSNDFIPLRNAANFPKQTGLYEIVEIDSAGNYTIYSVYLYSDPSEVLTVTYDGGTQNNQTQTFEDTDAEIGVFNSFKLKKLDINGDNWYNINIKKDNQSTSVAYRHTPALADGEVYVGGSTQKTTLDKIQFDNNSKYVIEVTSRQKKAMKTLIIKISTMSRRFDVSFLQTDDGAQIIIEKDDILEIDGDPVVEFGEIVGAGYVYTAIECTPTYLDTYTKIDVAYDKTKLLRLSLPTNFSTTQYFFYIHGQQQVEDEVTGDDLITTDTEFDYVSSHDVNFTYNNLLYNVVVGAGSAQYSNDYVEKVDGSLTTLTLKAAAFTYDKSVSTVGGDRTFKLQIRSLINSAGSGQESDRYINIRINNLLPQVNLYNDYGEEQNVLFSGGITRQDVIIRFGAEDISYKVTICKKGESQKTEIVSGHKVGDFATYEITCALVGDRTASYTKYFTITQTELSVYAVITKDKESDEEFEFLQPSKSFYEHNGRTLPFYITNKPYVSIKTDSSLDIEFSATTIYSRDGAVTRLYTISNTHKDNQNIYVNDQIVITTIPQTNQILKNFYKVDSSGADVKISDLVSDKKIMTSLASGSIESVRGNEQVTLRWDSYHLEPNNKILVTYLFENQTIFEKKAISSLILSSSGKHTLIFEDMAGNRNVFTQNIQQSNSFDFYFIRSVVFKINDNNPIDYAVFNGEVKISIPDESMNFYDSSSSPQIVVKRAGEEIEISGKNRVWTVSETGFYEVSFLAKWLGEYILVEPAHFSIINPTESRLAYEFVGVEKYEVVSVLKGNEEIIDRLGGVGVRSFSATLADENTGEGRYTVTVRAKRDDENLPVLDFSFGFWLHQANPPIVVSVEQGTETKDVINVQFNIYNLYDEVGDCYVQIGNMDPVVLEGGNLSTMDEIQSIDITSRGDYFIQVYTKSGNLVYSYRVIKKDPLNTVTIVLICVGAAVLVALTIVFVKLRKKVKIR